MWDEKNLLLICVEIEWQAALYTLATIS